MSERTGAVLDLAGVLTLAALLLWVAVAGRTAGADADPVIGLLAAAAVTYAVARAVTRLHAWAVPAVVAAGALLVALVEVDVLLAGPLSGPLGYSNAAGAFFLQAAAAAVMVAVRCPVRDGRFVAVVLAVAFAAVPWGNGTDTAAVLVLGLAGAGAVAAGRLRVRRVLAGAMAAVAAVLVATVAIGATEGLGRPAAVDRALEATLSERRGALWSDALVMIRSEPLTGVGPGRYVQVGPTARSDRDMVAAHHELLQLAAETGLPGLALALVLLAYVFAQLWLGPRDAATAAAGVALAALVVHASVDYVLHFPEVALAAAAVVGAGGATRPDQAAQPRPPRKNVPPSS